MLAFLYILLSLRELKAVLSDPVLSGLHLKLVAGVALSYLPPFYKCLGVYDMGLYVCCHVLFVCFLYQQLSPLFLELFSFGGKPAWTYTRKEAFVSVL